MSTQPRLALFDEVERLLSEIKPEEFVAPDIVGIPKGSQKLGPATEKMKALWTLWCRLQPGMRLGKTELLRRAVHTAMCFEVGRHFGRWTAFIGINSSWEVFAQTGH